MSIPDFALDETFDHKFTTRSFTTGVPTVLGGTPVIDIYEDNDTTPITGAETLTVDFNSIVGFNNLRIVATSGNGFESGKSYSAVIETGTVGGVSVVGETIWEFTIERSAAAADLANGTDGLGAIKADTASTLLDTGTDGVVVAASSKTGYSLAATGLDAIVATATGMVEIAKAIWDRVLTGGTHNIINSAGRRLRQIETAQIIHNGTAQAGSLNSITLDTGASTIDGFYDHTKVVIVGGTGVGQEAIISEYVGSTRVATTTPAWRTTPDATSEVNVKEGLSHSETVGGGYDNGSAFVSATGVAGTQLYVNGTIDEPIIDTQETDVRTVIDALNMERVTLLSGASMTLTQTWNNYTFFGVGGTIPLASQDIGGSRFVGLALTGIATGSALVVARDCILIGVTINAATLINCNIRGTLTLGAASNYTLNHCVSGRDDTILNFGAAVGNTSAFLNAWSGTLEIQNLGQTGTDVLTITGNGNVTFNANCVGGTVNISGNIHIINNGSGITFNEDAAVTIPKISTNPVQNQVFADIPFQMVDATDRFTFETGLTVAAERSIDGGAFAAATGTVTEIGNGVYHFDATAADMNGTAVVLRFTAAGAADGLVPLRTTPA